MSDISKCYGGECPLKEKGYRFTAPANEQWQTFFVFVPFNNELKECDMFYAIE